MKKTMYLLMVFALMGMMTVALSACGNGEAQAPAPEPEREVLLELTLEELAEFDGKDGNPAYVAVDGVIYDMSNSSKWRGGIHNDHEAGQDLTEEIKTLSPHGIKNLERVPIVGKIVK